MIKVDFLRKYFTPQNHIHYLLWLIVLLSIKAAWAYYEISSGYINLDPDEAQYWTWSQNLDYGFYSKPPGIAWQIWLGCKLFGQTELGVRSMSILMSILTSFALYFGALKAHLSYRIAFISALIFAFSPIGMMGTFAATTDGGFILFWSLALYPILEALSQKRAPNYLLVSLFILCGALFKWPIYLLWVPIVMSCIFCRYLYHKGLWQGMALSLAGLLPSVIWNSMHGWPTFRHTFTQTTTTLSKGNFWEFFGAQFAVLSPILFILLMLSILEVMRQRKTVSTPLKFSAFVTTLILGAFLLLSSFKKIQANWALYAYPTSTYLIAWYGMEVLQKGSKWLARGLGLSLMMVLGLSSIPLLQSKNILSQKALPFKANPFQRLLGWNALRDALSEIDYEESNFLFSDTYQMSSILSFYGPVSKRQYFFNTENHRQNQFCFWPSMAKEKLGQTGYYVWSKRSKDFSKDIENEEKIVKEKLSTYFDSVELIKVVPLFKTGDTIVKGALIFKCTHYNGKEPQIRLTY